MYVLSLLLFMIACVISIIIYLSRSISGITIFWDLPSVIIMVLFTVPVVANAGLLKDFNNAFRFGIKVKEKVSKLELYRAIEAVTLMIKTLWGTAILSMAISLLSALERYAEDISKFVIYFAISLEAIVYAAFFTIFLFPLRARLNARMGELLYGVECHNERTGQTVCEEGAHAGETGRTPE